MQRDVAAVAQMAAPIAWSLAFQVGLMLIISAFAGRLGLDVLAAFGLCEVILVSLSINPMVGVATGGATLVAHAVGAQDWQRASIAGQRTLVVALVMSVAVVPLLLTSGWWLRHAVGAPRRVANEVASILGAMAAYPLLQGVAQTLSQYVVAAGHASIVSVPSAFCITLTPLVLYACIAWGGMGPAGLGIGWLFAVAVELVVVGVLAVRAGLFSADRWAAFSPATVLAWEGMRPAAYACLASFVMFMASCTAMEVVFMYVATFLNECELATNTIIHQVRFGFFVLPGAWALAAGVIVAHRVGERDVAGARRLTLAAFAVHCAIQVGQMLVLVATRDDLPRLWTTNACTRRTFAAAIASSTAEQVVEQALFFNVMVMRSLHATRTAAAVTIVSWWVLGFAGVYALRVAHPELRVNVAFFGTLAGQAAGLAHTVWFLWMPSDGDSRPSVWAEAVRLEREAHGDADDVPQAVLEPDRMRLVDDHGHAE